MANRYWVGGTGNWNDTAKWSASSGGASGASVPTSSDDVFFDANSSSGSFTVTIGSLIKDCRDFNALAIDDAMILDVSSTGDLHVYGNWSNPAALFTVTGNSGHIQMLGVAVPGEPQKEILTNGVTIPTLVIGGNTSGTTRQWKLTSTLNVGHLSFGEFGYLTTNGYTINVATLLLSYYTTTSIFTCIFNTINVSDTVQIQSGSAASLSGTTINMTSPNARFLGRIGGYKGITVSQLNFTSTTQGVREIGYGWYFLTSTTITFSTPTQDGCVLYIHDLSSTTPDFPIFNLSGTAQYRYLIKGQSSIKSLSTVQSIFKPNSATISYVDFFCINCITSSPLVGTSLGDVGNNNNIAFQAARNVYWNQAAGGNWSDNAWALSSGGAVSYDNSPLPQDTAYIVDTGLNNAATITINNDVTYKVIPSINGAARTLPATISIGTEIRFIGISYSTASVITFSSVSSSVYFLLSPTTGAANIDIAGTIDYLKLASSWTYAAGVSAFSLNRNLTVNQSVYLYNGTFAFNTYTLFCVSFVFYPSADYLNGLDFTGGGLLKASVSATFKNAASVSVIPDIIGTSDIEVGAAGVAAVLTLPDSTNSALSAYGRKLNVTAIDSSSFSIQGDTPAVSGTPNSETNIFQIRSLDFSSCFFTVTLGNSYGFNSIAIYGDFIIGASTNFTSFNPSSDYRIRQFWVMSADENSPPSTTITTNGNTNIFGYYSALVFNADSVETSHEFILGDNLNIQSGSGSFGIASAVGLVSGKLNLNGKTLSAKNFIIGPYYYVRWLNSTSVSSWQDIYQKQLVFNGGAITINGVRKNVSQYGGTPSTWNTFGWECVSSPSLVSIENGTSAGTITLRPAGDGTGYFTDFRGGCTTSNSTSNSPSATPVSYPCIVRNSPTGSTNGYGAVVISGNVIFNNTLTTQEPVRRPSFIFTETSTVVINGDFIMVGGATTKGKLTSTSTTKANIVKNGTNVDPTNVKVSYTNVSGTGLWIGRQSYGVEDLGNNTGWLFTTTVTNNNISESAGVLDNSAVLVVVVINETVSMSESAIQISYADVNENMVIYEYLEADVDFIWNNVNTDDPPSPDWASINSI